MREVKVGQIYQHFKGWKVSIIALAKDSETLEEVVVYNHLGPDEADIWIRSKEMFLSKVDKEKYPNVSQEYRFELIES